MAKEVLNHSLAEEQELAKTPEKEQINNIYQILTRREVRREYPPAENEIKEAIAKCLENNEPIELVIVWGGFKNTEEGRADEADEIALNSIQKTIEELNKISVKTKVKIYLGDLHAISPYYGRDISYASKSTNYLEDIAKISKEKEFETCSLASSLYGFSQHELKRSLANTGKEIDLYYTRNPELQEAFIRRARYVFWQGVNPETRKRIMQAAEKYTSKELIEKEGLERIALLYVGSRLFEKNNLEESNKNTIFISFGSPIYELQPEKTIFTYSVPRGRDQPPKSEPPWLRNGEKELGINETNQNIPRALPRT